MTRKDQGGPAARCHRSASIQYDEESTYCKKYRHNSRTDSHPGSNPKGKNGLLAVRGAAGLTSRGSRGGGCGNKGINEKELNHFFTLTFQDVFGSYSMLP